MTEKRKGRWMQLGLKTVMLWALAVGAYLMYGLPVSVLLTSLVVAAVLFLYL